MFGNRLPRASLLASTEVREALSFPTHRKQSFSGFITETHPRLGEGCQDRIPELTGMWHTCNELGSFPACVSGCIVLAVGKGRAEAGTAFHGSPSCTPRTTALHFPSLGSPWASCCACDTGGVCCALQAKLSHPIGSGVDSFLLLCFYWQDQQLPFSPLLTVLLSSLTSESLMVVVSHCAET